MSGNKSLHAANRAKNDEFYTELADIDKELRHYKHHFKNKTVYCNCDDPRVSNFFHYFSHNFETLGLKKLMATCYKSQAADLFSQNDSEQAVYLIYEGDKNGNRVPDPSEIQVLPLKGDGDFRSEECIALLKQADIVVTNPPFSLFREYVAQLVEYDKKFLIIGNKNAITYKEIFPLIKDDKMWLGVTPMGTDMLFGVPDHYAETLVQTKKSGSSYRIIDGEVKARAQACWFTNLDHDKRHEELILYKRYTPEEYSHYDNYDAIEISKVADIPCDFDGVMGVPITFLDKHNPDQFEIVGATESEGKGFSDGLWDESSKVAQPLINGEKRYKRIFIKRRQPEKQS
ncbi:modification methylase [Neisseria sp. HMSC064F04]|jgi:modification methylase ecoRI|uniref:adenine-specific methyltransferase EcoRI family protein n=1 Tax=Neisseria mucosa TaxID=488 RepID=UPI0008A95085|nr:adenine-specific methyltransferase EcoRI family protein [Neisseria mucosa]OHR42418.1 modification methylase [Neisseria sp. HMSC064F04]OHR43260.1 modification methylase [Neisseria sp. HMSC070E12]